MIYESIEELKYPEEYEDGVIIVPDNLNEKEKKDPRVLAMFKQSRHNDLLIFIISQEYSELPKLTVRAIGNINHIFKPNKIREVLNFYQD